MFGLQSATPLTASGALHRASERTPDFRRAIEAPSGRGRLLDRNRGPLFQLTGRLKIGLASLRRCGAILKFQELTLGGRALAQPGDGGGVLSRSARTTQSLERLRPVALNPCAGGRTGGPEFDWNDDWQNRGGARTATRVGGSLAAAFVACLTALAFAAETAPATDNALGTLCGIVETAAVGEGLPSISSPC